MKITETPGQGFDCNSPESIEITISHDGKTIWMNIEGKLMFRAYDIGTIHINDSRTCVSNNGD